MKRNAATRLRAAFFWRRLDQPGYDSCRLFELANGWRLVGSAVFCEAQRACHFNYTVDADANFLSRRAAVVGFLGNRAVDLLVRSVGPGRWRIAGASTIVAGCPDIDLGFTPATNLLPLRRLRLRVGQAADAPAAYLNLPALELTTLPQRYLRIARDRYEYESPTAGYAGTLRVSRAGAVVDYPGIFELVNPKRAGG